MAHRIGAGALEGWLEAPAVRSDGSSGRAAPFARARGQPGSLGSQAAQSGRAEVHALLQEVGTEHAPHPAGGTEVRGPEDDPDGPDVVVTSESADALVLDIDQTFGRIKVVHS